MWMSRTVLRATQQKLKWAPGLAALTADSRKNTAYTSRLIAPSFMHPTADIMLCGYFDEDTHTACGVYGYRFIVVDDRRMLAL